MDNRKLTSVRVGSDLFQEFKEQCVRDKFSLQKLVDRAIFLYITDKEFKKKIESQVNLKLPK
jgi:hypothetical protein